MAGVLELPNPFLVHRNEPESKLDEFDEKHLNEMTDKDVIQLQPAISKSRGGISIEKDNLVSDLHRVAQTKRGGSIYSRDNIKEKAAEL